VLGRLLPGRSVAGPGWLLRELDGLDALSPA
jgi:hypothetical protein